MPIEATRRPADDVTANVAAQQIGNGGHLARVLKNDQEPEAHEWRTVAHFAVCPPALRARQAQKQPTASPPRRPTEALLAIWGR